MSPISQEAGSNLDGGHLKWPAGMNIQYSAEISDWALSGIQLLPTLFYSSGDNYEYVLSHKT